MLDKDEMAPPDAKWVFFSEFCRYDGAAGGPDPHMKVAAHLVRNLGSQERLWMAGCYMGTYVVPSAEVIHREWPLDRVLEEPLALHPWLEENWAGIVLRRERRAVRTPLKFARYLSSFALWAKEHHDDGWLAIPYADGPDSYEEGWEALAECWGVGRYIAIKGLEFMRIGCGMGAPLPDLRAAGGWSPRQALAFLMPEYEAVLLGSDTKENCAYVQKIAGQGKARLEYDFGVALSWYEFQTFLCDWKQCYAGRRQYPGRSLDSEIAHAAKVWGYFGSEGSELLAARSALFPHECLGELNGWDGVREELGNCQAEWNYTWSDLRFSWAHSKQAIAFPQERQ